MEGERAALLPPSPTPVLENPAILVSSTPHLTPTSTPLLTPTSTVVRDELEEVRLEEAPRERSGLPHSESRQSLQSRHNHSQPASRARQVRRQKAAQLPAHGEVQRMEHSLLKLLDQFNCGQLRAFDTTMLVQMETVRDQQEAIARRHFELGAEQDLHPPLSDDGLAMASENMSQVNTANAALVDCCMLLLPVELKYMTVFFAKIFWVVFFNTSLLVTCFPTTLQRPSMNSL